jgi:hypothetical protein
VCHYNASGKPGIIPSNNPLESHKKIVKSQLEVLSIGNSMVQELPLLVVRLSSDGYRVKREYAIETNPKPSNKDLILWKYLRDDKNINIVKDGNGGYWVNNTNYEGQTID